MNYYDAREVKNADGTPSGRWDYTRRNDDVVVAVGYCRDAGGRHHASAEEARACYRQWLLDHTMKLDVSEGSGAHRTCQFPDGCDRLTAMLAVVDQTWSAHLCDEHRTTDVVARLFPPIGSQTSSW